MLTFRYHLAVPILTFLVLIVSIAESHLHHHHQTDNPQNQPHPHPSHELPQSHHPPSQSQSQPPPSQNQSQPPPSQSQSQPPPSQNQSQPPPSQSQSQPPPSQNQSQPPPPHQSDPKPGSPGTGDGNKKPLYDGKQLARKFILAHNEIRLAKNVKPLSWNRTLKRYATRWANQRVDDCLLMHSPKSPYGENLFWSLKGHWTPADVVKCWADESSNYDAVTNECINNSICGHYTQLVWKATERVGCARVTCNSNKGYLYVCSYDPPGNYYFEGPFGGKFQKSIVYPPPPAGEA
ncbi:hypothetical protein K2173_001907 [Erythroxylum novogranatense]|uniref:SCP domain-containing protein n=1 Tax=Erythroxylum novogranatense TaxID=1862640 RepID=A0AAV8SPT4_9ROSI|nr:hypothetical protein K2173_001907 [Erythroxylum novogranatense]